MKSPSSYKLYDMEVSSVITYDEERDDFTGFIDITFSGTNSFGAEIKDTENVWVDIETRNIEFTDYTIWGF